MLKILIGGSPCTHWSIAKKDGRETEPSGIGWELFLNYEIARKLFKPDLFLYENVTSASPLIKEKISEVLGVDLLRINSALVSAQNRDRIYGVNQKIELPADRGILLRDILESGVVDREKSYALKHQQGNARDYFKKRHTQVAFEPIRIGTIESDVKNENNDSKQYRVYSTDGKSTALCGEGGGLGAKTGLYAVPLDPRKDGKARTLLSGYAHKGCNAPFFHYPHGFNKGGIGYHDKSMCLPASAGSVCNHGIIEEYRGRGLNIYEVAGGAN